jgi:hypothetical protein
MKLKKEILIKLSLAIVTFMLLECGSRHNSPAPEEIQLNKLNANWAISSVMKDGMTQSGYNNLKLVINGSAFTKDYIYAVTGRPAKSPWPAGGTWTFGTDINTQIIRDKGTADELPLSYSVADTSLTIQFQFNGTGYTGGKTSAVTGNWSFVFTRH